MQAMAAMTQAVNGAGNGIGNGIGTGMGNGSGSGIGFQADAPGWSGNGAAASAGSPPAPFAGLVTGAVQSMNALNAKAASLTEGLMEGTGVDIHQAMIATAKADQAFELALAVRNKAVGAYQQVMNMQF